MTGLINVLGCQFLLAMLTWALISRRHALKRISAHVCDESSEEWSRAWDSGYEAGLVAGAEIGEG